MRQNQCCRCTCTRQLSEGQGVNLADGFCRKDNWEQMGTYDINMTEWGGEHIEVAKTPDGGVKNVKNISSKEFYKLKL